MPRLKKEFKEKEITRDICLFDSNVTYKQPRINCRAFIIILTFLSQNCYELSLELTMYSIKSWTFIGNRCNWYCCLPPSSSLLYMYECVMYNNVLIYNFIIIDRARVYAMRYINTYIYFFFFLTHILAARHTVAPPRKEQDPIDIKDRRETRPS
ncbi:hypothetical protein PUN28_002357 [Cardiocondyla obscurior]|uniref:Uncharacterized protein n=1 Tax=Cardiocondyla obscurior TaxID=286306 RepID=A0AAW2GTY3_9HYME